MDQLHTDLHVLQSHLDGLLGCIRQNESKLHRFQTLESQLLCLNSLCELIEHSLDDTLKVFDLEVSSFCLVDEKNELTELLKADGLRVKETPGLIMLKDSKPIKRFFGKATRLHLGKYNHDSFAHLFHHVKNKPASVAILPLVRRGVLLGSLNLGSADIDRFSSDKATDFLERFSLLMSVCLENTLNFELLRRTSFIDTLTGINNRRFFDQRLDEEIHRVNRSGDALSCLFLDIDHFKSINDTYGHLVGDQVLSEVANEIRSQLRNNDILARYGGEEFVALIAGASEQKAMEVAERIRKGVENSHIESNDGKIINVTISIGVSRYIPEGNSDQHVAIIKEQFVNLADQALYEAKRIGRNCVMTKGLVELDLITPAVMLG